MVGFSPSKKDHYINPYGNHTMSEGFPYVKKITSIIATRAIETIRDI
jgi:hypothetical protein